LREFDSIGRLKESGITALAFFLLNWFQYLFKIRHWFQ